MIVRRTKFKGNGGEMVHQMAARSDRVNGVIWLLLVLLSRLLVSGRLRREASGVTGRC